MKEYLKETINKFRKYGEVSGSKINIEKNNWDGNRKNHKNYNTTIRDQGKRRNKILLIVLYK